MRPYKQALVALTLSAVLISQTPAVIRAEDGGNQSSSNHCYMSRMVNGNRWSTCDCSEMRTQMNRDLESLRAMLGRLGQPVETEKVSAPNAQQSSPNQGQPNTQQSSPNQGQPNAQQPSPNQGQPNASNPEPVSSSNPGPDPVSVRMIDSILAFLQHLLIRLPVFWR